MARIHRRSAGTWEVILELGRDPQTRRRLRRHVTVRGTKRDAEREAIRLQHQLHSGMLVDPTKETVGALLERWLRDYAMPKVAPSTLVRYRLSVDIHLLPTVGQVPVTKLRPAHIVAAMQVWRATPSRRGGGPISETTVRNTFAVLRQALGWAVRLQTLSVNPADAVDRPQVRTAPMRFLSEADLGRLLDAMRGQPLEALFSTLVMTGMRSGEVRGLRWSDVDLDVGTVRISASLRPGPLDSPEFGTVKSHRSERRVELPADLGELLRQQRARQVEDRLFVGDAWAGHDLVFTDALGRPVSIHAMRTALDAALKALGLQRVRIHDLRHSHVSAMLAAGENPRLVSERVGHARVGFTLDVYGHTLPGQQRAAADRLSERLGRHRGAQGVS